MFLEAKGGWSIFPIDWCGWKYLLEKGFEEEEVWDVIKDLNGNNL
jgi:hypothetical protein